MQGIKSAAEMALGCHSVWCLCQKGFGGPQFAFTKFSKQTWPAALKYIDTEVKCVIKTEEVMCMNNHYSYGVHRGGKFTRINCHCGYNPSEKVWRADMKAFFDSSPGGSRRRPPTRTTSVV